VAWSIFVVTAVAGSFASFFSTSDSSQPVVAQNS
jgi:hypothetical protein